MTDDQLNSDFCGTLDWLVKQSAQPVQDIKRATGDLYTKNVFTFYWNPVTEKVGSYSPEASTLDWEHVNFVFSSKFGSDMCVKLDAKDLNDWQVKAAYSPLLRTGLEIGQFLPSTTIPGFGGRPIASTLASGLIGAGLGYGTGVLAENFLPEETTNDLRSRLAIIGGLGGAGLGAIPGMVNVHNGKKFNDAWTGLPGDPWESGLAKQSAERFAAKLAFAGIPSIGPGPRDLIRTNELGQVMWGSNPEIAAMTAGTVYSASRMPDQFARPGFVTPHQTGLLGMAMGAAGGGAAGYATGKLVGSGLGILTGMPNKLQQQLAQTGLMAGIVTSLIPRLFNR